MMMLFCVSISISKELGFQSLICNCFGWWNRIYLNSRLSTMIFSNNLKEGTHRKVPVNVKIKIKISQSSGFLLCAGGSQTKVHLPVPESHDNQRQVSLDIYGSVTLYVPCHVPYLYYVVSTWICHCKFSNFALVKPRQTLSQDAPWNSFVWEETNVHYEKGLCCCYVRVDWHDAHHRQSKIANISS